MDVITDIDVLLLETRLQVGLAIHGHTIKQARSIPVVRIQTEKAEGYGEAPPLPTFTGFDAHETLATLRYVVPSLLGKTPPDALYQLHHQPIDDSQARAAIDIALHDLIAKQHENPLYKLLGHSSPKEVRLSRAIGLYSPARAVELATEYRHKGLTALKLKVGRGVTADATVVHNVREAVGSDVEISIDANGAFSADAAWQLWKQTRGTQLAYFEQPVARHDIEGLQTLRKQGVYVLADESASTANDVRRLAQHSAVDGVVIKLIKCGGLRPATEMIDEALSQGLDITVVNPLGSAISLHADLHLASQLPPSPFAHGLSAGYEVNSPYAPHTVSHNGHLHAPNTPGLGVSVTWVQSVGQEAKSLQTERTSL